LSNILSRYRGSWFYREYI